MVWFNGLGRLSVSSNFFGLINVAIGAFHQDYAKRSLNYTKKYYSIGHKSLLWLYSQILDPG